MKKILLALGLLLICPQLAFAQTSRNPCYTTTGQTGLPNCVGVGTSTPLPVTGSFAGTTSNATSGVATSSVNSPSVSYNYGFNGTSWDQLQVDSNKNLLTSPGGAPNLLTAQVSVSTTDTATVAARIGRRSVTITNITGTQQVYCSNTTATTANGQLIPAVVGANWTVSTAAAIRCISVTGAQTVSVAEVY
jgi:hypothetical protein